MFKRVRWMGLGAVAGFGASMWAQHRLRRTLDEHPGIKVSAQAVAKARSIGLEMRDALADGRDAMAEREAQLRADLDARLVPIRPADGVSAAPTPRRAARGGPRLHVVEAASSERPDRLEAGRPPGSALSSSAALHPSLGGRRPARAVAAAADPPPTEERLPERGGRRLRAPWWPLGR